MRNAKPADTHFKESFSIIEEYLLLGYDAV
jgi:hypothetical protein